MKKFWILAAALGAASAAHAAPPVYEQVITSVGTGTTVSVSTTSWTAIPTTSSLSGRTGMMVTNDSSNASNMALIFSASSTTPTEATTVRPMAARPGQTVILAPGNNVYVYALYLGSSAANIHVQECRQN